MGWPTVGTQAFMWRLVSYYYAQVAVVFLNDFSDNTRVCNSSGSFHTQKYKCTMSLKPKKKDCLTANNRWSLDGSGSVSEPLRTWEGSFFPALQQHLCMVVTGLGFFHVKFSHC